MLEAVRSWGSEKTEERDPETGAAIWRITEYPAVHHHFYFTRPSWTPNGQHLLFVSDRPGSPNLFAAEWESGEIVQLTDEEEFNRFSATPAADSARVFYTAGEEVRAVYLDGGDIEVVGSFPGAMLGACSLSADGTWVATVVRRHGRNAITAVMTGGATGSTAHTVLDTEREIGHVQFAPTVDNTVLYSSDAHHRIWTVRFDGTEDRWLYGQGPEEWITHETWRGNGDEVFFVRWPHALMAVSRDGTRLRTVAEFNAWHPASRRDGGLLVCDTTLPDIGLQLVEPDTGERRLLCQARASSQGTQWKLPRPAESPADCGAPAAAVTETTYGPQWTHPHPSFSPDGQFVVYTSDVSGHSQVYVARVER